MVSDRRSHASGSAAESRVRTKMATLQCPALSQSASSLNLGGKRWRPTLNAVLNRQVQHSIRLCTAQGPRDSAPQQCYTESYA